MRKCILQVFNLAFGCFVELHFEGGGSIIDVFALNEDSAMTALRDTIEGKALCIKFPLFARAVYDQEELRSLTLEHLEQATRIVRTYEFNYMTLQGTWREEKAK